MKDIETWIDGKLYGLYSVISNKTVRKNESFYKRFKNKNLPGTLVKTNRGYFIDGYNVDLKSAEFWFSQLKVK